MSKQKYIVPVIACMPINASHSVLAGSGDGMPLTATGTNVTYEGPGGSAFTSDEEVAAKRFYNVWEKWEE